MKNGIKLLLFALCVLITLGVAAQTENTSPEDPGDATEENTGNGGEKAGDYGERLDKALTPDMAATLAGLAITAAIFLISFTASVGGKISMIKRDGGSPSPEDLELYQQSQAAVKKLMMSFYFFIAFLVESLTLDLWDEPGAFLASSGFANLSDLLSSSGFLGLGLWFFANGTRMIGSIVSK